MQFYIGTRDRSVSVDDYSVVGIDTSSIASNISVVQWYGGNANPVGELSFNDRPNVRSPFSDPSPYLPILNTWIKAAAGLPTPGPASSISRSSSLPLTVVQAQTVKSALVDALFSLKNQAAFSYNGFSWDASDAETTAMANAVSAAAGTIFDSLNSSVNSAFTTIAGSVNTAFSSAATSANNAFSSVATSVNVVSNSNVSGVNSVVSNLTTSINTAFGTLTTSAVTEDGQLVASVNTALSNLVTQNNNNWLAYFNNVGTYIVTPVNSASAFPIITQNPGYVNMSAPTTSVPGFGSPSASAGSVTATTMNAPSVSAPTVSAPTTSVGAPNILWTPLNGPQQSLTFAQFTEGLLSGIVNRRATLQAIRLSKKVALAALTTVADIANYDITTGW